MKKPLFLPPVSFFINPQITIALALFYIIICISVSFLPETNFLIAVISRCNTKKNYVALIFNYGPDEPVVRQILDLLGKYSMPVTFFVTVAHAHRFPEIIK
jgi:peptidoglycan/xylan/chitin deacetylase (PgdA/CDA1 family)